MIDNQFLLNLIFIVTVDSSRRGSYTPQPQRAALSSGLTRRSQSFDQLDDTSFYTEIPFNGGNSVSPLTNSYSAILPASMVQNSTPPPPIGYSSVPPPPPSSTSYNSAPPPPPPPVHRAAQPNATQNEVEVHPEGPPAPPPSATNDTASPHFRYSGIDWHTDLKEKLRRRTESLGNCSPKRPTTPIEEQSLNEDTHRSLSVSSPSGTNQGKFSMTPPATPPTKRSEVNMPPPCRPKPNKANVISSIDENEDDSPFAKALKATKLKKVISNDRSAPKV